MKELQQKSNKKAYGLIISLFLLLLFCGFFLSVKLVFAASVSDTFTGVAGTTLASHVSDSGNTWSISVGGGTSVLTNSNRLRSNSSVGLYVSNWIPASADYDVSEDLYFVNTLYDQTGVSGRAGAAAFTGYYATFMGGPSRVSLYRGGNVTPLASFNVTVNTGETHNLKLSMRGTNIKVYWDSVSIIDVTPTGADIVNSVGLAGLYNQGTFSDSTGIHVDNFLAVDHITPLSAGVLSSTSVTSGSATLSWTSYSGGISPITSQLQRSLSGTNSWTNVAGATSSPVTDTGLTGLTSYDYRVVFTDSTPTTVYSNTVTITTNEVVLTYALQQADLWDNGYDNISAPRQSDMSRFVFTTDAASFVVTGATTMYDSYPQFSHLGVRIDGVNQSSLVFTANGTQSFTVPLGIAGTTRTVEIIAGIQSNPGGTVLGSFIDSVAYGVTHTFSVQTPTVQVNRLLVYGDSISSGGNATNPEIAAYVPLLRNTYGHSVMLEGWGYRSLYDDVNTPGLRNAFVSRLAGYSPSIIWLAIGTNDYGFSKWSATNFGTAYAETLDALHAALPSTKIVCQTPLVRNSEFVNGLGNTLADYRNQISTVCGSRLFTTFINGTSILTTSDLDDGVHPSTAGHAKYALKINSILTAVPTVTTSAAASINTVSAILNGSIDATGDTTPTVRGFMYGLTTSYEVATTVEAGSFGVGSFSASVSSLTPNTTYHFRSYTTNFAGTVYGSDQTFTTLIQAPTGISFDNISTNDITISASGALSNITTGSSGLYFSETSGNSGGANSGWLQINSWQDTNLSCGTAYTYSVKYRNSIGIETNIISTTINTTACPSSGGLFAPIGVGTGAINKEIAMDQSGDIGSINDNGVNYLSYINSKADFNTVVSATNCLENHHITIDSLDLYFNVVQFTVQSTPQIFSLKLGETIQVDLDGDKIKDIEIKFVNVLVNRIELTIKSLANIKEVKAEANPIISVINKSKTKFVFKKDLKLGMINNDVKELQKYLNANGFVVAKSGYGAKGKETITFGTKTKFALIKFQKTKKIIPANGSFESSTRKFINR